MEEKISIIILAAGKGTRMKSSLPKVLHKISGFEMLYYSINEAKKISDDITVVLYHEAKLIQETMGKYFTNINYVLQNHTKYPGTGGALMNITPKYQQTLVLNGDMPLIEASELKTLIKDSTITMSVLNLKNADGYGRVIIEDYKVEQIIEQKDCTPEQLNITTANAGVYCFNTEFLINNLPLLDNNNSQNEYYITDLIELAVSNGYAIIPIYVKEESFKGVNSKFDLSQAEILHQHRIKEQHMKNGITLKLPDTIYIEYNVTIEGETIIENNVNLLGNTKVYNSHIKTGSIIEDSIIETSEIGPIARVRPNSTLKDTHIGNFVEVKKATLIGVKAGHLSYLGDCKIDVGTNIGAGTITCNYDGKNKNTTIIGKNVFIGSDSQLIAPLTIEDDTIIAAGSTITQNVHKGDLAISRTKQKSITGFFYKFFQ